MLYVSYENVSRSAQMPLNRFNSCKPKESVRTPSLMAVILKMAHKVDLKLAERRISQSLNSKMLRLEDAACASVE